MSPNAQPTRVESFDRSALAELLEPPYTDPYVRGWGRGGGGIETGFRLLHGARQRQRRRLSEQRAVGNRKAPELQKAVVGNNLRDSRLGRIRTKGRPPHEVHSAQGEITDWPHAEMLL